MDILEIFALIKIVFFGLSLLLTLFYCLLILSIRRLHNRVNILILNICFTTFCATSFFLVYFIMWEYYIEYLYTVYTCTFVFFCQNLVIFEVAFSFVTLTINRFFSIVCYTKVFFQTKKFMVICIACQWIAGALVSLPFTLSVGSYCNTPPWVWIYAVIINTASPTVITLVVNLLIFKHVHSSGRRIQPQNTATTESTVIRQKPKISRRDLYLLRHTIVMLLIFVMAWTPIFALVAIDYVGNVSQLVYSLLQCLAVIGTIGYILDLFFCNHDLKNYVKDHCCRCF